MKSIKSISEYHKLMRLPSPKHPLISILNYDLINRFGLCNRETFTFDFYSISIKRNFKAKMKYGQQQFDFNEGVLFFIAPGQTFEIDIKDDDTKHSGWGLLIHPDFFWKSSLAVEIKEYEFLGFSINEALFLSAQEEMIITEILKNIEREYSANVDQFTKQIIVSQVQTFLNYSERFYQRQFITRQKTNHHVTNKLDNLLNNYFGEDVNALPSVQFLADKLCLSPNYLNALLKSFTGQTTQQHIHEFIIRKAKEKLSNTNLSVSEIAYELGFEHTQSFHKLFKLKTNLSPLGFRKKFG